MYQSGLMCKMSFDMISSMTPGNLVDYIISYTDYQERIYGKEEKKKGKTRMATQADFDNF